jgi:anthrone oxygenase-like protein
LNAIHEEEPMRHIAEFVAVLACSLFTGASIYISLVEHPARMACGVELAATEFPPSYRRATIVQVTSAALGLLSSMVAWFAGATFWWVVAGALLGSVMPFTLIVILPTNKRLLSPDTGSALSTDRAATHTLGRVARREKHTQWIGAAAFPVLGDLQEDSVGVVVLLSVQSAARTVRAQDRKGSFV